MDKYVIKVLIFLLSLSIISCKSKLIDKSQIDLEKQYNYIINDIVSNDLSSIKEHMIPYWQMQIDSGYKTSEQVNKSKTSILKRYMTVNLTQSNDRFIYMVENDIKENKELTKYFGQKNLKKGLECIENVALNIEPSLLNKDFIIMKENHDGSYYENNNGHYFSSPMILGNKMIIEHTFLTGFNQGHSQILIYKLSKDELPIKLRIVNSWSIF
jgi:hypothetical protein